MKITVVIPAHNEAKAIGPLVTSVRTLGYDCLVVDDGSRDGTADIALRSGASVIQTGGKTGKGNALKMGFAYALKNEYEVLIVMDGDGQHAPGDIEALVTCYQNTGADIITGNRMGNAHGMPWLRWATNHVMSGMVSLLCRQHIPDTQCGFRLITTKALKAITITCSDFEIETEILVKGHKAGFRIGAAPIQTIYRDEVSKINPGRDTLRFMAYLVRELLGRNG